MLFNSLEFFYFLPACIFLFYAIPRNYRWIMLLLASYIFYMAWRVEYAALILSSTLVDYFCALGMGKTDVKSRRRIYLLMSLIVNLGLLFSFKYYNFLSASFDDLDSILHLDIHLPHLNVLLPVGISFYTFQTLSYTIDVYHGRLRPEKHFGYFALFVAYFPQLVAGPIERYDHLAPQFRNRNALTYNNISNGLRLVLFGLFIKMAVADNLAPYVDEVYANPDLYCSADIATAILFYSFQIYSDFYGYSLIAIGSARLMGVHIMDNFKTPYLSRNIAEFWHRWHISLSTWFRDYLFFPLGGSRVKKIRWSMNILIVFTLSGIWHGANWTFLFWGCIFGLVYLAESQLGWNSTGNENGGDFHLWHGLLALKTFLIVSLLWVFFRSQHIGDAFHMLKLLFDNLGFPSALEITSYVWVILIIFILLDLLLYRSRFDHFCEDKPMWFRWSFYLIITGITLMFSGVEEQPFIYFQF